MKECVVCWRCLDDSAEACPDDGSVPEAALPGGVVLDGKYRLEQRLGAGGMGVVFRARHLGLGREVAVKLIRAASAPEPGYLARFRTEAAALGKLKHPGIVDVTDFGVDPREGGVPYLVMEFLEGLSLDEHCRQSGPLPLEAALPLLDAIAEAVDHAHANGVLHRDLKPANVLLVRNGEGAPRVKLLDFGLARLAEPPGGTLPSDPARLARLARRQQETSETLTLASPDSVDTAPGTLGVLGTPLEAPLPSGSTQPGQLLGTPAYMAPERFSTGESSPSADVYAMGVTAFLLLTGRVPFSGSLSAVAHGHLSESPPLPSQVHAGVPEDADRVLLQALAKDPSRRPASARALVEGLRSVARAEALRHWRGQEVPRRLAAGLAVGVSLAALAPTLAALPPVAALERRAIDARTGFAPPRALDPRLLIVMLDDQSLAGEARSLADMGGPVASRLERVVAAGAKAVAIDLLLPAAWGRSGEFARFVASNRERVTLAAHATPDGVVGTEAAQGLVTAALGEELAAGLFGLANLEEDEDGVVRRARVRFPTRDGGTLASFAAAAASRLSGERVPDPPSPTVWLGLAPRGSYHLDFVATPGGDSIVSWRDLPVLLERTPEAFAGKLVILGARLGGSGDDAVRVPGSEGTTPGVMVQARAVDTILSGFPVREPPGGILASVVALSAAAVAFAVLCGASPLASLGGAALLAAGHVVAAFFAFRTGQWLAPVAGPVLVILAAAGLALGLRAVLPRHPLAAGRGVTR